MAKTKISEYSSTNSSNTDINSINIDEGCAPSGINNAIRELMVHLKNFQTGASSDPFTVAGAFVSSAGATFSGSIISSGANTFSGTQIITGNINSSGTNTFSGNSILTSVTTLSSKGGSNTYTTSLTFTEPTTFRTITFPDKTGTVAMTSELPSASTVTSSSGSYAMAGSTTVTITLNSHGRTAGDSVYLNFTSGDATDGNYTIASVLDANTFTVTEQDSLTTSGNVTVSYSNVGTVALISSDEALVGTSTSKAMTAAATKSLLDTALTRATSKNTTAGTFVEFTGISSTAKRITILFDSVSQSASGSEIRVQVGTSSGYGNPGTSPAYTSNAFEVAGNTGNVTNGFVIAATSGAGDTCNGAMVLYNISGNKWVSSHSVQSGNGGKGSAGGGIVTLSGTLDRLRLITNSTNTFDAGSINIMYE